MMLGHPRDGVPSDDRFSPEEMTALLVAEVQDYAILMLDPDGRVATWNAGARRFKGYAADEIIGRHFSAFYPPEAIALGTPEALLAAARRDGRVEEEGWRVRRDGSRFWASVVITALRDRSGTLRGYGKVTRDLTERHAAELAREASEQRFRAAFEHAPIGVAIAGLEGAERGRFVEINSAFAGMLGYRIDELIGATIAGVTHPADLPASAAASARLQDGEAVSLEMRFAHRDGHEVWALVSSTPLPTADGDGRRLTISQVLDISERKRFETRLRHLADHDALTGLHNRHRFESELERVTSEATRHRRGFALLVLDLDGFKEVNDRFGHPVGDELVARIGRRLGETVRASDIVARLGGDEFAIIQPITQSTDPEGLADRILEAIRERGRVVVGTRAAQVTASIRITVFDGTTGLTGAELVVEADRAMYVAKAGGRDRRHRHDRAGERRPVAVAAR